MTDSPLIETRFFVYFVVFGGAVTRFRGRGVIAAGGGSRCDAGEPGAGEVRGGGVT